MLTNYPVNPRVRAYGKARIDMAMRINDLADWETHWKPPSNPFPFAWGESWKQCVEYRVDDFAAEVGFFIDILGFQIKALDANYAMFTSPQADFFFAIVPTSANEAPTSPDALRLQFMVRDVFSTYEELLRRGIAFELPPQPICPASSITIASFRTPNGIPLEIWGFHQEHPVSTPQREINKNLDSLAESSQAQPSTTRNDNEAEKPGEGNDGTGARDDEFDDDKDDYDAGDDEDDDLTTDEGEDKESIGREDEGDYPGDSDEDQDVEEADEEDEDDADLDEDFDEEDDDYEFDEDEFESDEDEDPDDDSEDDFDSDEYSSPTLNTPPETSSLSSPTRLETEPGLAEQPTRPQQGHLLEYVDLEIA